LLPVLYGAPFADASLQFLILLPGVYLIGIESVLVQHFNSTGLPAAIPLFWLATLAINIILNLALVPTFGARAAAATATFSYAMIFALIILYFRIKTGNPLSTALLLSSRELRELFHPTRSGASAR
jgi:O-antigen/teichoic acid export membrane protein